LLAYTFKGCAMSDDKPLLNTVQVAAKLGLSQNGVRNLCDSGELPHHRIGAGKRKEYRVHPDDLAAYIERSKVRAEIPTPRPTRRQTLPMAGFRLLRAAGYQG
jgi:excisionase family DNA binding protein